MPKDFLTLDDFDLAGKTLLVRVDINSPINPATGEILDDTRIIYHSKTIRDLKKSKVVLIAHQSRPGKRDFTTLEKHADRLTSVTGRRVKYIDDFFGSRAIDAIRSLKKGEVVLLENVRFYAEEHVLKGKDIKIQAESHIVSHLAGLGDYFVNDAFAAAHRNQPTLVGFTEVLPSLAGRVMENEIKMLDKVIHNVSRPSIAVLGGVKVYDTLQVMSNLLRNNIVDKVLTSGLVANIFLLAQNHDLDEPNTSFLERELGNYNELTEYAIKLLEDYHGRIEVPTDLVVNDEGKRRAISVKDLPAKKQIFDIGLDTAVRYRMEILKAGNIIMNGPAGVFELEEFAVGTTILFNAIAESKGFSVIGGGESVAAARNLNLEGKVGHISTGGGACISFLAGKTMPAIEALCLSKKLYEEGYYCKPP